MNNHIMIYDIYKIMNMMNIISIYTYFIIYTKVDNIQIVYMLSMILFRNFLTCMLITYMLM